MLEMADFWEEEGAADGMPFTLPILDIADTTRDVIQEKR